jgi:hypothetical protein
MAERFREDFVGNLVLGMVLVSDSVSLGTGNRLYPGVVIECRAGATVTIGTGNVFWPGTVIVAEAGCIVIGSGSAFGPGGCTLALDDGGGTIEVGDRCRLREGVVLLSGSSIGSGAQVLGPIQVTRCRLGAGGAHTDPGPAARGGVLKDTGRARSLVVGRGEVILGAGRFNPADLMSQLTFHPPAGVLTRDVNALSSSWRHFAGTMVAGQFGIDVAADRRREDLDEHVPVDRQTHP